jgi:tetratricopeptide (TPR) repeat protein
MKILYYMDVASHYGRRGATDTAIGYSSRALGLDSDNFYALLGLTVAFVKKKDFHVALLYGNRALSSTTTNVRTSARETLDVLMAVTLDMLGESESAKQFVQSIASRHEGERTPAYNMIANTFYELGLYEKARAYCREAIMLHPEQSALYWHLGSVYYAEGCLDRAKAEFARAVDLAENQKCKHLYEKEIRKLSW